MPMTIMHKIKEESKNWILVGTKHLAEITTQLCYFPFFVRPRPLCLLHLYNYASLKNKQNTGNELLSREYGPYVVLHFLSLGTSFEPRHEVKGLLMYFTQSSTSILLNFMFLLVSFWFLGVKLLAMCICIFIQKFKKNPGPFPFSSFVSLNLIKALYFSTNYLHPHRLIEPPNPSARGHLSSHDAN
jgi:hypothetical protein